MRQEFRINGVVLRAVHNTVLRWGFLKSPQDVKRVMEIVYLNRLVNEEPIAMDLMLLDLKEYYEFEQMVEELRLRFPEPVVMDQESIDSLIALYKSDSTVA